MKKSPPQTHSPAKLLRDPERRRLIKEMLAGYRLMNELDEEEMRRRLPKTTEAEARKIFEDLYSGWEYTRKQYPNPEGEARLARLHLHELIEQRRVWDKIAHKLGEAK